MSRPANQFPKRPTKIKHLFTALIILLLLWMSVVQTDASFTRLFEGFTQMYDLVWRMLPPDLDYFDNLTEPILETLRMALLGTTFGAIISVPFILLCASNVTTTSWLHQSARVVLNVLRTVPDLLLAAIFAAIVGYNALAGVLALTIFSIGIIAKLSYEATEVIDPGPLEAMKAVGANHIQWIIYSVLPQVMPKFASYVLYTFEVNVRAAAILGLVGAGGIGLVYDQTLSSLQYERTTTIILYTLLVVILIDWISTRLQERLR
ncbi:phosphonate ABC transporter, permease protein PhnE [Aureibacillus halotolerans]|uniref:Phosphonate transport system permease protein n=1 Tax=Aureibacillus halotolerans TaxID=1508390 RepID=A0A4R6UHX5_9BACI|nr:phosphonate ABC transporter, permease protein PhnE [Aureibacillus halotolerans]TDQ42764.1 phosphonate transport system permease protein [Aureibacillus halotolerans]